MPTKQRRIGDVHILMTVSFWSSVGLSLLIASVYLLSRPEFALFLAPDFPELMEVKLLDLRFLARGPRKPPSEIVMVTVDEKTEDALGRWQSAGRQWLAQFLDIMVEGNAAVVGFDLTLAEPDDRRDLHIVDDLTNEYQNQTDQQTTQFLLSLQRAQAAYDYDRQLADAISRAGNVVLGIYFLDEAASQHLSPEQHAAYQALISRAAYQNILFPPGITAQPALSGFRAFGVEPNLPLFSEAALSFGFFNVTPDADGYIRSMPLLEEYGDQYYPALALEVARAYINPPLPPFIHTLGKEGGGNIAGIELADLLIPCDDVGRLFINYYGPAYTFTHYSLSDVLAGTVPAYKFADKIVLIGFTSLIIRDLRSTPFQPQDFPGVEVHATVVSNLLTNEFLIRPAWGLWLEAGEIVLLGLVLAIVRHRKSPIWGVWAALVCIGLIAGGAYLAFLFGRLWLNLTYPILFIVVDYLTITSYKYFTEERQKRVIKSAFQYYVSSNVVSHLLNHVETLHLGGERKQLTALFSDIRGFTSISENMSPEALVEFLNEYLSAMSQIVLSYDGTIDKYMGDAIMAFYGAPVDLADHAVRACKTAVDMLVRLKELRVGWEARGLPPMDTGIGINSGDMSVGNMGSKERFDYTIMGDHVNLASRLEGLNKEYGTNIVISQFTYDLVKQAAFTVRELDTVRVIGRKEAVRIYELLGYETLYEQKKLLAAKFWAGLAAYKQRDWSQAITLFEEALHHDPHDKPSQIYIERCRQYLRQPPPNDWDGIYVMHTK